MTVLDRLASDLVLRRIRRDWRDDIKVVDAGEEDGREWVALWCGSPIACEQARISLAAYVRNPVEDWTTGWDIDADACWTLRLWEPRSAPYENPLRG